MRILFEEHQYNYTKDVGETIKEIFPLGDVDRKVSVSYVGYFYSPELKDCVFILPKVLLCDRTILIEGHSQTIEVLSDVKPLKGDKEYITPEDIITPKGQNAYLTEEYKKFIYEFSVWIYRALRVFKKTNPGTKAIYERQLPQSGRGKRHEANTYLDIVLSLIKFNQENQDFFLFTIKNLHAGMNKINWTRTLSKSQCFIQKGTPIYLNPVNKKRIVNFDEELFVIFFSILAYLNDKYGFRTPINFRYELLSKQRFDQYLKGYGMLRLRQIRYKYFSDRALRLWDICFAFFDSAYKLAVNADQKEFLWAKSFEHVFEGMIDNLIGTPHQQIPKGLADQKDGKRVDHMYAYDALIQNDEDTKKEEIYYIGDSKYYKAGNKLDSNSVYKQYTYARNVIQWNINLFLNDDKELTEEVKEDRKNDAFKTIRIRREEEDNVAEGYNIIPNFFLSAFVYPDRRYVAKENIKGHPYMENGEVVLDDKGKTRPKTYISYQFPNRLFDRDTLILSHYDVNFLYVLYLYARQKAGEKARWKNAVRQKFRDEIRKVVEEKFDIYAMLPHDGEDVAKDYISQNFQRVLGKIFTPYNNEEIYSLALSKEKRFKNENKELKDELGKYFYITDAPIAIGTDPSDVLYAMKNEKGITHIKHKKGILIGLVPDEAHWKWIETQGKYNIRKQNRYLRKGSQELSRDLFLVNTIILYRMEDGEPEFIGEYGMLSEDSIPTVYKYEDMRKLGNVGMEYPYGNIDEGVRKEREYIIYELDIEHGKSLVEVDKKRYSELIKEKGRDENGRIGIPFII